MLFNILITSFILFFFTLLSKLVVFSLGVIPFSFESLYALFWGLQLDLTTVAIFTTLCLILNIPTALLFAKNSIIEKLPIILISWWIIISTTADAIYFIEAGRHITFEVFTGEGSGFALFITCLIKFPLQSIAAFTLCVISAFITVKIYLPQRYSLSRLKSNLAYSLVWIIFAVTMIRGGWHDHPQSPMSVYKIGDPKQAEVAWNAPYAITYYLVKGVKKAAHRITPVIDDTSISQLRKQLPQSSETKLSEIKPLNIIFLLLESWGAADMKSYANHTDVTPFFNQLRKESFSPHSMYANGFRTVEGMFASFCSYSNPIGAGVAGTQLQNMNYMCLPRILNNKGWSTHFVQGSGKGIVGSFSQTLGFKYSYGEHDYNRDSILNHWGYMDDDIYQFSLDKIKELKSPYFIAINTGTTHDTYLPNESDYNFGTQSREQIRYSVLNNADKSLEKFIVKLNATVTEPTIVVLMSDHTAGMPHTGLQRNSIPFLMYGINVDVPKTKPYINASQRDVAPTILDIMGGSARWFTGQSMFDNNYSSSADFSQGKSATWIKNNKLVKINAETGSIEQCAFVGENTIDLENTPCESEEFQALIKEVRAYTSYSQQLLYNGETASYS